MGFDLCDLHAEAPRRAAETLGLAPEPRDAASELLQRLIRLSGIVSLVSCGRRQPEDMG